MALPIYTKGADMLKARIKAGVQKTKVYAFCHHEFVTYEWRDVPKAHYDEARANPLLELWESPGQAQKGENDAQVKASPQAIALAQELGIDLADVTGTGKDGAIKKADVVQYVENMD